MSNLGGFDPHAELLKNKASLDKESITQQSEWVVNMVFARLEQIFPNAFDRPRTQLQADIRKREWLLGLFEGGIKTSEQIDCGVKHARRELKGDSWPTIGQFVAWCSDPAAYGLPDTEKAFKEACQLSHPSEQNKEFSHPVVEHAWIEMGPTNLLRRTYSEETKLREKFEYTYLVACRLFMEHGIEGLRTTKIFRAIEDKTLPDNFKNYDHIRSAPAAFKEIYKILGVKK